MDLAALRFMAEEARRIVDLQFQAGTELADKAEALVKANGVLFGLILAALGLARRLDVPLLDGLPAGFQWLLLWAGPICLFSSMAVSAWAFKSVSFEVGLRESQMRRALGYRLREEELLAKAIVSYAAGIRANRGSINTVENLVTVGIVLMAAGSLLTLAAGVIAGVQP